MRALAGVAVLVAAAVLLSTDRRSIRPSIVLRALALQFLIAIFLLRVPWGQQLASAASEGVLALLGFAQAGIAMVFGPLGASGVGFSFALGVLPVIVFFASLMAVLYHLGIMPWVVRWVGGALQRLIGVGRNEALNSAANVFVGLTEAPLVIRPYLGGLTEPQLFCVMVAGLASVAGSVLGAYAALGVRADYLLTAAFMSAPGGLAMAKLVMPDSRRIDASHPAAAGTGDDTVETRSAHPRYDNVVLAAAQGAADGLRLAVNIGAMLLAFVSLIALLNGLLALAGSWFGHDQLSVQGLLGAVFSPVLWLLGVPWSEAAGTGALFGEKLVLNEFLAFTSFAEVASSYSPRTQAVTTFSLCGFANLAAIAVLIGGLGGLIPERRSAIARFGPLAVLTASLANLMSAAMVGLILSA